MHISCGLIVAGILSLTTFCSSLGEGLRSQDLSRFRFVSEVRFSPDGKQLAYTVTLYDHPGSSYSQLWLADATGGSAKRIGGTKTSCRIRAGHRTASASL